MSTTSPLSAAPADGISDANRGTWSRLTRLHLASAGLSSGTSFLAGTDRPRRNVTSLD